MISGQSPLVTQRWLSSVSQKAQSSQGERRCSCSSPYCQFNKFSILTVISIIHFLFLWLLLSQGHHTAVMSYSSDPLLSLLFLSVHTIIIILWVTGERTWHRGEPSFSPNCYCPDVVFWGNR